MQPPSQEAHRFAVYLHIPYCRVQCPYCTFYTVSAKERGDTAQRFVAAVIEEWRLRVLPRLARGERVSTLYLGGGTPSDLPLPALDRLLGTFAEAIPGGLHTLSEVTVECNPESATPDLLDLLRERGVNRISLGIQAFDAADLRRLGRVSTPAECRRAIGEVAARFPTWSADLILGIPGSGRQRLESALEELVGAGVPHLSFYCLEAPPARARRVGDRMDEASESLKADLYRFTAHWVEMHGFDHYEISNAARPGHWARHNRAYWQGETYVGLGPGAHSLEGGVRIANLPRLDAYLAALEGGDLPPQRREARTPERIREEAILLGVRTSEGIPLDLTRGKEDFLRALTRRALAGIEGERLRLTPEGWLFADEIAVRLIG